MCAASVFPAPNPCVLLLLLSLCCPRALARKGNALVKLGRLEEAVAAYNKSLMEHRTADTLKKLQEAEKALKVGGGGFRW